MISVGTSSCPAPWPPLGQRHVATGNDYAVPVHLHPTVKAAREAANNFVDDIAKAVVTQTFVAHSAADLPDEEMEILPHPSRLGHILSYFQPLGH